MAILRGAVSVPSDKSLGHRGFLFSALAKGLSTVSVFKPGRDNLASLRAVSQLGARIKFRGPAASVSRAQSEGIEWTEIGSDDGYCQVTIESPGLGNFSKPTKPIYCGNSGTTARLLCGILATCSFETSLDGDRSLRKRPFARVREPLELMGAKFSADTLPLEIEGGELEGIDYRSPVASAQVKSAIILASLAAKGDCSVVEPCCSRDHTERMLSAMGVGITSSGVEASGSSAWRVVVEELNNPLSPLKDFTVPGDFSSAAFLIVAALLVPGSEVTIENCGVNPSRIGLLNILKRMGASIECRNERDSGGEAVADLVVKYSELSNVEIEESDVVEAIDEIPILAVAASFASGSCRIRGAKELRVKETDRLQAVSNLLRAVGVAVEEFEDGLDIEGLGVDPVKSVFSDSSWQGTHDHRIEMSASVLDMIVNVARDDSYQPKVLDREVVETSFPEFEGCLKSVIS